MPRSKREVMFHIRLSQEEYENFKTYASLKGLSVSEAIRKLVRDSMMNNVVSLT